MEHQLNVMLKPLKYKTDREEMRIVSAKQQEIINGLSKQVKDLQDKNTNLNNVINGLSNKVNTLQAQNTGLTNQLNALQNKVTNTIEP